MRIRIVNQYFPPDGSATAAVFSDLARVLHDRRHEVTFVAGRPSYDCPTKAPWRPFQRRIYEGIALEIVGSTAFDRRRSLGRLLNYVSFIFFATIRSLTKSRPDVVVVGTDPPLAILTAFVAARGRPVVYSLQDLHPEVALMAGWIRPGTTARLWDYVHRVALKRAALIVCLGQAMQRRIVDKGVTPGRVVVIANGAHPAAGSPLPEVVREIRNSKFVIVHAGNIGHAGAWSTIIGAARLLGPDASFVFVGDGVLASELVSNGLTVSPFRPQHHFASVMAAGDMQLVTTAAGMEGFVVPSKIYTILAHGRPVLAVVPLESDVAHLVAEWQCGIVADPNDPADVARKIDWAKNHPEKLQAMSSRAKVASSQFRRSTCMTKFAEAVEAIARGNPFLQEDVDV